ncbi:exocyst complex component exo84 [Vermiconidia calcicola]|uniref:Exocyst complex component exo84 n=1 Tax=Vermiconidia calcicola TaxID=1690605 RepID=A0ACC3NQL7_9PEZI|nr:exocyst complex component exo84 [Vermiconidia calcicola]
MSESKGISLRRKKTTRPTISAPRQLSHPRDPSADSRSQSLWDEPTNGSATNLSVPAEARPRGRKEKTEELVKRRYSTRFAGGQPIQDGGFAPPMPSMPAQYTSTSRSRGASAGPRSRSPSRDGRSPSESGGAGRLKIDMRALKDPNLQAEKYVQSILADATESDVHAYQNDLQSVKSHASMDLQHNVYQNRTQFIKISKEADKLKSEMRTLRTLMSDLTGALGHATNVNTGSSNLDTLSVADRKRANRSSVANLEAMWSTHLQVLWKRVEGSQKYLPALPGRHIILESQRWVELNAATWKPRRRVALCLLNDHLLVASEKRRNDISQNGNGDSSKNKRQSMYQPQQPSQQTTLVAERCWPLQDVQLADISSSTTTDKNITNALNLRVGPESFTYASSDAGEKAALLVAFRKAQEDLRKHIAAEHGERERQLETVDISLLTGARDPRLLKKAAADAAKADVASGGLSRSNSVLVDVEGRQQSIRWVESQVDALDIDIALQRFEDAVSRVEKLRKLARSIRSNATASEIIMAKVNERANRLAASIGRQLVQTSSGTEKTKQNTSWLLRLGLEEMARLRYLDSRTETIRIRTRQLPFTGPLPPYLHALAYTTFALLLHTFRTFAASFPPAAGSSVVKWGKERVDEFNGVLERQLSSVERGGGLWRECVDVVKGEVGVLSEVGVDFRGLVGRKLAALAGDLGGRDGASWGEEGARVASGSSGGAAVGVAS